MCRGIPSPRRESERSLRWNRVWITVAWNRMNPPNIKWIWNLFIYVGFSRIGKSSNMCHTGKNTGAYVMSIVYIDRHTYVLSSWVMCSKRFWYHILAWTRINGSFVCTCRVFYWVNRTVASWCDDCFFRIPAVGWLEFGRCGRCAWRFPRFLSDIFPTSNNSWRRLLHMAWQHAENSSPGRDRWFWSFGIWIWYR